MILLQVSGLAKSVYYYTLSKIDKDDKNKEIIDKIKEIFIENKIPLSKRNNYPLLVDAKDNILWIPNIKKSNLCNKKEENYDIIIKYIEGDENNE